MDDSYDLSDPTLTTSLAYQIQLGQSNIGTMYQLQEQEQEPPWKAAMDIAELFDETGNRVVDNGRTIEMPMYQAYPSKRNFYKPSLVSIGPKYSKEVDEVKNKEYKNMYLKSFLEQHEEEYREYLKDPGMKLLLMDKTRKYYKEIGITCPQNDEELVDMLLLDGCFVVEFVLKCKKGGNGDPCLSIDGKKAREDMILFENQLPFDVLEAIYTKKTNHVEENVPSFVRLVKFAFASLAPNFTYHNFYDDNKPQNPMDLIHVVYSLCLPGNAQNISHTIKIHGSCFCSNEAEEDENNNWVTLKHINTATELQEVGVSFKNTGQVYAMPKQYSKIPSLKEQERRNGISLFDITFSSGEMSIPCFKIDNSTELFFRNMIALEQQRDQLNPKYYTDFARLMNHLVDTNKDISLLRKNGTIHNLIGEDWKAAYIFNNVSVEVDITSSDFYSASVYTAVDEHCRKRWYLWKHRVKKFFYVLWKVISITLSAISLLLLAIHELNN